MGLRLGLIAIVAAMAASPALAQKGTAPTSPLPGTGATAAKPNPATAGAKTTTAPSYPRQVTLLCRNLAIDGGPRPTTPNDKLIQTASTVTYENITIRDASGTTRTIYAPIAAQIVMQFKAAAGPVGDRGERLRDTECGFNNGYVPESSLQLIRFNNPAGFSVSAFSAPAANLDASSSASVQRPYCPSGVISFIATQAGAGDFAVSGSPITCVQ